MRDVEGCWVEDDVGECCEVGDGVNCGEFAISVCGMNGGCGMSDRPPECLVESGALNYGAGRTHGSSLGFGAPGRPNRERKSNFDSWSVTCAMTQSLIFLMSSSEIDDTVSTDGVSEYGVAPNFVALALPAALIVVRVRERRWE